MSYVGSPFSDTSPAESEIYAFDFGKLLAPGETIATATFVCEVYQGVDLTPSTHVGSSPVISGSSVSCLIENLLPGVSYRLKALANTSAGQVLSLYSHVNCVADS